MDAQSKRLAAAIVASLLVNGILWRAFGSVVLGQKAAPSQIIEFSRVELGHSGQPKPKVVTRRQIARRVEQIRKLNPPKRLTRPLNTLDRPRRKFSQLKAPLRQRSPEAPTSSTPNKVTPQTPRGAHNNTLTALAKPAPNGGRVKPSGQANPGQPLDAQNYGDKSTNPSDYKEPPPQPSSAELPSGQGTPVANATSQAPAPTTAPDAPTPSPTPIPTVLPTPRPTPTNTPVPPPTPRPTPIPEPSPTPRPTPTPRPEPTNTPRPTPTPRPKGPTRDAIATRRTTPDIPDDLRDADFKASVSVTVRIEADGSSSASLRSSSGNAQIDSLVLRALNRWRWKPALENGEPVASTQRFRFNFEVR